MHASEWIGLGVVALVIIGGLLLLNQITKPYDVKDEEEFQRRKQMGARTAGLMGLQQILDPAAKKSVEVQQDLRRGIYDDEEEPDDPPEADPRLATTCGASDSIKPGAQAPGRQVDLTSRAREASGRPGSPTSVARAARWIVLWIDYLGLRPGFTLTPAAAGSTQVGEVSSHA